MGQGRFISYLGILITLNVALWAQINVWWIFLLANLGWIALCMLLTLIEHKLSKLNKRWLDKIHFAFTRNPNDYLIKEKVIEYTFKDTKSAEYSEKVVLQNNKEGHTMYHGKFSWPDQKESIIIECPSGHTFETDEDTKWTKVDINPSEYLEKKKIWETGFKLTNLHMENFKKRSFLSVKTTDKVEKIVLRVKIGSDIPKVKREAILRVEDAQAKIIAEEKIYFNDKLDFIEKELKCLRLGRKYIIIWDYQ